MVSSFLFTSGTHSATTYMINHELGKDWPVAYDKWYISVLSHVEGFPDSINRAVSNVPEADRGQPPVKEDPKHIDQCMDFHNN